MNQLSYNIHIIDNSALSRQVSHSEMVNLKSENNIVKKCSKKLHNCD